jgi:inosine/xanthosine triphosphate pyrophosphatase family protein
MKICFASHNPGKVTRYKRLLRDHPVNLVSLSEMNIYSKIDEPFKTSQENAIHKAREYSRLTGLPTLGVDEEMQTNFLPENLQPGVLIRRLGKTLDRTPTDEEVINHWVRLIKDHPHTHPEFYWKFSIAIFDPYTKFQDIVTVVQVSEVADEFSNEWTPGYPMSTFMSPKGTNKMSYLKTPQDLKFKIEKDNFDPFLKKFPEWIKKIENLKR